LAYSVQFTYRYQQRHGEINRGKSKGWSEASGVEIGCTTKKSGRNEGPNGKGVHRKGTT